MQPKKKDTTEERQEFRNVALTGNNKIPSKYRKDRNVTSKF